MPFTITALSVSDGGLRFLSEAVQNFSHDEKPACLFKKSIRINLHYVGENKDYSKNMSIIQRDICASDLVIIDIMSADLILSEQIDKAVEKYKGDLVLPGYGSKYLRSRARLGSFSLGKMMSKMESKIKKFDINDFDMEKMLKRAETIGKFLPVGPLKDMRNMLSIGEFWRYACRENISNMLLLLLREYGKFKELPKPGPCIEFSEYILFDPGKLEGVETLAQLKDAWGWDESLPSVGILFYHFNYPNYTFSVYSQIINRLRKEFNVVPLGMGFGSDKFAKINKIIDEGLNLDIVWDMLPFRFGESPMGGNKDAGLDIFRRLNCPVMHPFFLSKQTIDDWKKEITGLNPLETIVSIMLPELDGVLTTLPVAGLQDKKDDLVSNLKELSIIEDRLEKMISCSQKYIKLKKKENNKKKIAIILYNYPPGEGNIGEAAYLDTFKSIENIISSMKEHGYLSDEITSDDLEQIFMKNSVCNTPLWSDGGNIEISYSADKYAPGPDEDLHKIMVDRVAKKWGDTPGKIMAHDKKFLIPGIVRGNIFIGLQPSRGVFEDNEKMYHDKALSPHHQYVAFYRWLEKDFMADAMVHVGTHGTLEFLPGKDVGLSEDCYPDYLVGSIPHFYIYYTGNPSEATIAKRRSHAAIISYSGPPFKKSKAYGDYIKLEDMINEYIEAEHLLPQKQEMLLEKIQTCAKEVNIVLNGDFSIDHISSEIIRMKNSLIPEGLHLFGKSFTRNEKICFISSILSWSRGEMSSLENILEEIVHDLKFSKNENFNIKTDLLRKDSINELSYRIIKDFFFEDKSFFNAISKQIPRKYKKKLLKTLEYGKASLKGLEKTDETAGLLKSLGGNYIDARLAGDFIRDPEVFPTGYNLFQFDARLIPSDTAIERGKIIAESTIKTYLAEHGKYPESVSLVLWGFETSKTKGETIGQILAYLGVKLIKGLDVSENRIKIIPLNDLKRPRIDSLITICGFFRDMFPLLLDFLDETYEKISMLNEPDEMNFVKKNSDAIYNDLIKDLDEPKAAAFSRARIFGPPLGDYGTNMTGLVESSSWKKESEIAMAYMSSMEYAYTRKYKGVASKAAFEGNLKRVDLVSQVRSSSDYTITDLDHYYEFFGGLAKSVETVKGVPPVMLFTDSSTEVIYTDDAKKAIGLGVRTRLLNPEYIDGMLKHKVHGAQQIGNQVTNLIGLAATTASVESWIFDDIKHTFLDNQDIYERLKENNRFAALDIIKRLLEAQKRDYWDADEKTLEELTDMYMELEGDIEGAAEEDY